MRQALCLQVLVIRTKYISSVLFTISSLEELNQIIEACDASRVQVPLFVRLTIAPVLHLQFHGILDKN